MGFGIIWFFLTLSIESSIIPIRDVIFEHRLYLPSVGFFIFGTVMVFSVTRTWKQVYPRFWLYPSVLTLIVSLLLSVATYKRNLVWRDPVTLWGDVVTKAPGNSRGQNNFGEALEKLGKIDEAIRHYSGAVQIDPEYVDAHFNLGSALSKR